RTSNGSAEIAGPSRRTTTARARAAAATPSDVERHPRVTPTARTIVSASTISTPLARNADTKRKTSRVMPEGSRVRRRLRGGGWSDGGAVGRQAGGDRDARDRVGLGLVEGLVLEQCARERFEAAALVLE